MENLLKEIIANNAIEYNKEESQDRAFIYVDDFINELKSKFKLLNLHNVNGSALPELIPLLISYFYPTTPLSNSDEMFKKRLQIIEILNDFKHD